MAGTFGLLILRGAWQWWTGLLPGCTVRQFTGLHCPGCGGTRCADRLLAGDLAGALSMNAAVALFAITAVVVVARGVSREWSGGSYRVFPPWLAWGLAGFTMVFGLVRNLPWWPFTLLVPH